VFPIKAAGKNGKTRLEGEGLEGRGKCLPGQRRKLTGGERQGGKMERGNEGEVFSQYGVTPCYHWAKLARK